MVDLPAPFTPTSATRSPRSISTIGVGKYHVLAIRLGNLLELGHDSPARLRLRES